MASVTHCQAWSENIRWKICRHKVFLNYNSMLIWVVWWSRIHSIPYPMGSKLFICPVYPDCIHYPPTSHLVAVLAVRQRITASEYLCPDNPNLHNNLEGKIPDAGGSDTPGEPMKRFLYVKNWKFLKRNWKHCIPRLLRSVASMCLPLMELHRRKENEDVHGCCVISDRRSYRPPSTRRT